MGTCPTRPHCRYITDFVSPQNVSLSSIDFPPWQSKYTDNTQKYPIHTAALYWIYHIACGEKLWWRTSHQKNFWLVKLQWIPVCLLSLLMSWDIDKIWMLVEPPVTHQNPQCFPLAKICTTQYEKLENGYKLMSFGCLDHPYASPL